MNSVNDYPDLELPGAGNPLTFIICRNLISIFNIHSVSHNGAQFIVFAIIFIIFPIVSPFFSQINSSKNNFSKLFLTNLKSISHDIDIFPEGE
ncbi:MAG TPA: hypothetical protein VHP32_03130 [Ignavibacteria bacterium]|nr:hypothetical protein [Ignavibacteria bacterium]